MLKRPTLTEYEKEMRHRKLFMKERRYIQISERRNKLKQVPITCLYCGEISNLLVIIQHQKKKNCQEMKKLFFEKETIKDKCYTEHDVKLFINTSRQKCLNPEKYQDDDDVITTEKNELDEFLKLFPTT